MAPPTLGYKTQLLNLHSKVQIASLDAFNPHWAQIPFPYLTAPSLKNILFILFFENFIVFFKNFIIGYF